MFSKLLDWLTSTHKTRPSITAGNNWNGVPKPDLRWKEVVEGTEEIFPIIPMTEETIPDFCPVCAGVLTKYRSDWWDFTEGGGQFMVRGNFCPTGHWTHLTWA